MHPIFKPVVLSVGGVNVKVRATDLFLQKNGCVGVCAVVSIDGVDTSVTGWWKREGVFVVHGAEGLSRLPSAATSIHNSLRAMSYEASFEVCV